MNKDPKRHAKMLDRPDFPSGKVTEVQRSMGIPPTTVPCPFCSKTFTQFQRAKFWSHYKELHRERLGDKWNTVADENAQREEVLRDVFDKIKVKAPAATEPALHNPSGGGMAGGGKMIPDVNNPSLEDLEDLTIGTNKALPSDTVKRSPARSPLQPEFPRPSPSHLETQNSGQYPSEQRSEKPLENPHSKLLTGDTALRGTPKSKRMFDHHHDDPGGNKTTRRNSKPNSSPLNQGRGKPGSSNRITAKPEKDLNTQQAWSSPIAGGQTMPPNSTAAVKSPHPVVVEQQLSDSPSPTKVEQEPEPTIEMLKQPETRPISHDQLVVEVKGIYAGLVMVEAKAIEVDLQQARPGPGKRPLKNDQWHALIALHKQLLHEHHDFFLASQHPSASPNLSKLAAKYSMPARMWRHGIHAFLEVLRHRLPESLEHMLCFIYIAYSMMALLYETVVAFEDTWIECLGDLGRYRMAIEDDEPKDREVWSGVARFWYSKAADKSPYIGRLYHHLAILARPYTLEQLSLYTRSLTCVVPFESARGSIMTLFTPILSGRDSGHLRQTPLEAAFIRAHAKLFTSPDDEKEFEKCVSQLEDGRFDDFIGKLTVKTKKFGSFAAVSNIAALLEYGAVTSSDQPRSWLRRQYIEAERHKTSTTGSDSADDNVSHAGVLRESATSLGPLSKEEEKVSSRVLSRASHITFSTFRIVLAEHNWKKQILPFVHVMMVFLYSISRIGEAINRIEEDIPWTEICLYLDYLAQKPGAMTENVLLDAFPKPNTVATDEKPGETTQNLRLDTMPKPNSAEKGRPLSEDYDMRGQLYTMWYFPKTWFTDAGIDEEERSQELPSMDGARIERVLWLGNRFASDGKWIRYDKQTHRFVAQKRVAHSILDSLTIPPRGEEFTYDQDSTTTDDGTTSSNSKANSQATSMHSGDAPDMEIDLSLPARYSQNPDSMNENEEGPIERNTPKALAAEDQDDVPMMMDLSPVKGAPVHYAIHGATHEAKSVPWSG